MQDSKSGIQSTKQVDPPCHLCGGRVTYRGFTRILCATYECENFDGEPRREKSLAELLDLGFEDFGAWGMFTKGSLEWAKSKRAEGFETYVVSLAGDGPVTAHARVDPYEHGDLYVRVMDSSPLCFWDVSDFPVAAEKSKRLKSRRK